jgi:hypothetical protein
LLLFVERHLILNGNITFFEQYPLIHVKLFKLLFHDIHRYFYQDHKELVMREFKHCFVQYIMHQFVCAFVNRSLILKTKLFWIRLLLKFKWHYNFYEHFSRSQLEEFLPIVLYVLCFLACIVQLASLFCPSEHIWFHAL